MIITKIIGGLGNQMFQYAIARSIAEERKDAFLLDISYFKNYTLHNGYRLDQFNITENIASLEEIKKLKGSESLLSKICRHYGIERRTYYKEKEYTIFDNSVFEKDDIYLDGYWQNEKYFRNIRNILLKEFNNKNELSKEIDGVLKKIKKHNSVSIHIRRGDYLNSPDVGVLDIDYYKRAVKYINDNVDSPRFFVFSDDLGWCKNQFNFIENIYYVSEGTSEIDDFFMMKSCKHNIIANSTFSWWAAWLNDYHHKFVISPVIWMKDNPKNHKWACESWIEL